MTFKITFKSKVNNNIYIIDLIIILKVTLFLIDTK
jgi:hypothetical protein